ncbi:hypothetical protein A3D80_03910 [Candidatus Roizmanbacteria bacterium RIFCSPHIGHO2_02_FULL_40_13b]|uniref:PIN domain-containing protein n=1 Tax=Candidatus Roizmanbacteria bacterium RIFCSPHIGHO2_01_FULL_39_24 TaxID=1802032 RepID=A0A1F7GLP4_9BACT|nr:MAG: hypothetical protein A2799_00640 [Candidatus Roizmanbacteria bacterium RIFCSPHIGHO2_01_FULL_39_24]OGK27939.1 MAG: hypothetical protein A3D80_03910 [Candidatus Roizmanbacteria bacterium RIFCSPHIGHO2_02_FULL_40_13b]OGK50070.1 MAG: hypothetical protein A3A56_02145 [Candidatus Roizmanbacteria bacterium RIFCSPLOWO2_01_FULL_40_32]OGK56378.1 MAG: hypothetical protein A3H83_02625 [Candidatus Roizmanbacteria bacterium RIFCSPLOWO2_02_FULL_39_8]
MKYLIDTNIFLRILTRDNEKSFKECVELIEAIKSGIVDAITTTMVVAEVVWTLESFYRVNKSEVVTVVRDMVTTNGLKVIDGYGTIEALDLYNTNNIKFVDCLLASIPQVQKKEWAIISYDKEFDKLKIIRKEPGDVI